MRQMTVFFLLNATATSEIYTLSLHDALPIFLIDAQGQAAQRQALGVQRLVVLCGLAQQRIGVRHCRRERLLRRGALRSEEHTSELQSRQYLVCRLLLEKK